MIRMFTKPNWKRGMLALTITSACLWYNSSSCPISGRRRLDLFSPQFRDSSFRVLSTILEDQKEMVDEEATCSKERVINLMFEEILEIHSHVPKPHPEYQRVARIANRLVQSNMEMELDIPVFHIITDTSIQMAFSLARHICITTGTLDSWADDQLAMIIGHEMAHHALDHTAESLSMICVEMVLGIMVILYAIIIKRVLVVAILWFLLRPFKFLVIYPLKQQKELEADDLGMELMARACYDVRETIELWQLSTQKNGLMVSDHPSERERKERMLRRMEKMLEIRREAGCHDLDEGDDLESCSSLVDN